MKTTTFSYLQNPLFWQFHIMRSIVSSGKESLGEFSELDKIHACCSAKLWTQTCFCPVEACCAEPLQSVQLSLEGMVSCKAPAI